MEFHLSFPETGLANLSLRINYEEIPFTVSRAGDPFAEMFAAFLNFEVDEPGEIKEEEWIFFWNGVKWGYEWRFKKNEDKQVHLKIVQINDLALYFSKEEAGSDDESINEEDEEEEEDNEMLFDDVINLDELIAAAVKCADGFLKSDGIIGYSTRWSQLEFPVTSFLKLKKYLIEKEIWNSEAGISEIFTTEIRQLVS